MSHHYRGLLAFLSILAVVATTPIASAQVRWLSGASAAPDMTSEQIQERLTQWASQPELSHVLVQTLRPVRAEQKQQLAAAGLELLAFVGDRSFFARVDANVDANRVAALGVLRNAQEIQPEWKLHPAFADGAYPVYALVESSREETVVAAYVVLQRGVAMSKGISIVENYGGRVVTPLQSQPVLVVETSLDSIPQIAQDDSIQWVEPPLPALEDVNDSNRNITQAQLAQSPAYDLDGTGVVVMVYDGGSAFDGHADFGGRLTVRDNSGTSNHATHVSGTVGGDGSASAGQFAGMAPGCTIESFGLQIGGGGGVFLYENPGDLEADYGQAINDLGAVIANNSIGTNVASNGFSCDLHGDYGVASSLIDGMVRGSLGSPMRIVFANGNERGNGSCGTSYNTTAPPACAKNHITVGATNSNDDSMTGFSSWGPTDDGRLKPDVSAPGCESGGDGGVTSTVSNGGYSSFCGTSMAAPTVTGISALLIEEYRTLHGGDDPSNQLLKTILAHNAVDLGNVGPDYQFGYGSVRAADSIDFLATQSHFEGELQQGEVTTATIDVAAGDPELRVTLAWDDFPAVANVATALVNDLDLVVMSPSGTQFFPWTLDPANPGDPAVQTEADHLNNIEQVLVDAPEAGVWQIMIVGFSVPEGPQSFAVSATPDVSALVIELPNGTPDVLVPATPTVVDVRVRGINDTVLAGQLNLNYRFDGGAFQSVPLVLVGGDDYTATIPGTGCTGTPEFYFTAAGTLSGIVTLPNSAPTNVFSAIVGETIVAFQDDFETDQGWTVGDIDDDATTGIWTRVDPNGTGAQPEDDNSDPGTQCFVTGQGTVGGSLGENDVDGGKTTLFSPIFDLSGTDPDISYWRWFNNSAGAGANTETLTVDISNDGGLNWTNAETVGPTGAGTGGGWLFHQFRVSDFVTPTSQVQVRFITQDPDPGSLVEAAIDDFAISSFECNAIADCNNNGTDDAVDISMGSSDDLNGNQVPDECECSTPLFIRGDSNRDFSINITDATHILGYLFAMGDEPVPFEAGDVNDDGSVNLADPLTLLDYLFGTAPPLAAPFPDVGCSD